MKLWPVLLVLALVPLGCSADEMAPPSASPSPSALSAVSLASQHGLHVLGGSPTTLPQSLDALPWDLYQTACRKSGFDLRPYRGQEVLFTAHPLQERHRGAAATLWTISADDRLVGAYVSVDGEMPGVYSLDEAGAGF